MHRDLLRMRTRDFGGNRRKPGFVAVGQRQIAAARRKLERQRPADSTGGAGQGCRGSTDRSHFGVNSMSGMLVGKTLYDRPAPANGAAASAEAQAVILAAAMSR